MQAPERGGGQGVANRPTACPKAEWVADDASPHCQICTVEWKSAAIGSAALMSRGIKGVWSLGSRHHCRVCGLLICAGCSIHEELAAGAARMCLGCFRKHASAFPAVRDTEPRKFLSFSVGTKKITPGAQLLRAILREDVPLCSTPVAALPSIDAPVLPYNRTALQMAALADCGEVTRWLLSEGADPTAAPCQFEQSALHLALVGNACDAGAALLEAGVSTSAQDALGATPVHLGCRAGSVGMVRCMLSRLDANLRSRDNSGWTPLHYAASIAGESQFMVVRHLLNANAQVDIASEDGSTPLHVAAANDNDKAIGAFLAGHTNIEASDAEGQTPLIVAAKHGSVGAICALLNEGASHSTRDAQGRCFMDYAEHGGGASFRAICEVATLHRPNASLATASEDSTLVFTFTDLGAQWNAGVPRLPRGAKGGVTSATFTNSDKISVIFKVSTTGPGVYSVEPRFGCLEPGDSVTLKVAMRLQDSRLVREVEADTVMVQAVGIERPGLLDHKAEWVWHRMPTAKVARHALACKVAKILLPKLDTEADRHTASPEIFNSF